jgi:HEAT repeat protein
VRNPTLGAVLACALAAFPCTASAEDPAESPAKDAAGWVLELKSDDVGRRQKAAYGLWRLGPAGKDAIPAVAAALRDPDEYVRNTAANVLGGFGQEKAQDALKVAIPELLAALADPRVEVRRLGALALWKSGGRWGGEKVNAGLGPALTRALDDPDPAVRTAAAGIVGNYGPWLKEAHPALLRHVRDESRDVRVWVVRALDAATSWDEKIDVLLPLLSDPDAEVRAAATGGIGVPTPRARIAVPALVKAFGDPDPAVREAAAGAFVGMSGQVTAPEAVPGLLAMLEDESGQVRATAAAALGQLGDVRAIEGVVKRAVDDVEPGVRAAAAGAIGGFGPEALAVLDELLSLVRDGDEWVAQAAILSITSIGAPAADVERALRDALGSRSGAIHGAAATALGNLDVLEPETVEALAIRLREGGGVKISAVANALRRQGPRAAAAVPALVSALDGSPELAFDYVVPALATMGSAARDALPKLRGLVPKDARQRVARAVAVARISALPEDMAEAVRDLVAVLEAPVTDGAEDWRYTAAYAVADIGEPARAARGALAVRFVASERNVRGIFGHALVALGGEAVPAAWESVVEAARSGHDYALEDLVRAVPARSGEALPALLAAATSQSAWTRAAGVASLGRAKTDAPEVVSAIRAARNDPSGRVRAAAAIALRAHGLERLEK